MDEKQIALLESLKKSITLVIWYKVRYPIILRSGRRHGRSVQQTLSAQYDKKEACHLGGRRSFSTVDIVAEVSNDSRFRTVV